MALEAGVWSALARGVVIPAHPLALTSDRRLDERRQRALSRYYLAAGAGGLAVGVHTTQFAIRDPRVGLLQPVLELAAEVRRESESQAVLEVAPEVPRGSDSQVVLIAGACGDTRQAISEARLAADLGYDLVLLQLGALANAPDEVLVEHCRAIGEVLPLFGFYLQPAVGGRPLNYAFWRQLAELDSLRAIKIAPFNRYATLDVMRAVADSGRSDQIALYTGNDDHIVLDLLTCYQFGATRLKMVGGLLGHWAVWTKRAVQLLDEIRAAASSGCIPSTLLTQAEAVTDCNAAFFDPSHAFAGSIAGLHEVLRRQGLLAGRWCLDPKEDLSPGQMEHIDRVYASYPQLNDDMFVAAHLDEWLA
jgi:dihydrodipicolinate synthase/N-acetylneuraminate lyase